MSKHNPETRPVMTIWGRVVHVALDSHLGIYHALCGRSGRYTAVAKSDAVTCKRCRKVAQGVTNEHR